MNPDSKIYIAGHRGLVGSALLRSLVAKGYHNLVLRTHANNTYPAEFIRDNLVIQSNIIHSAWQHNVTRLLFLGSTCIYPK